MRCDCVTDLSFYESKRLRFLHFYSIIRKIENDRVLFLRKKFNREERKAFSPLLHCLRNRKGVLLFFTDTSSGRKKAGKKYQDVVSRETCLIVCNRFSAEVRKSV